MKTTTAKTTMARNIIHNLAAACYLHCAFACAFACAFLSLSSLDLHLYVADAVRMRVQTQTKKTKMNIDDPEGLIGPFTGPGTSADAGTDEYETQPSQSQPRDADTATDS